MLCIAPCFGEGVSQGLDGGVVRAFSGADVEHGRVVGLTGGALVDFAFLDLGARLGEIEIDLFGTCAEGVAQGFQALDLLEQALFRDRCFFGKFLGVGA